MKAPTIDETLLQLPLSSIGVSKEFATAANSNNIHCLKEILGIPLTELVKMTWFTPAMFEELSKLMNNRNI